VNDLIRQELNELRANASLSAADHERLELHFDSIRDLEKDMLTMGLQCSSEGLDVATLEAMNSGEAFSQNGQIEEVAKLHARLVAFAFACNATRVATLQVGDGTDGTNYTIAGEPVERFHWISHRQQADDGNGPPLEGAFEWHVEIDRIRMNTFKDLIDTWSAYATPNGPLLDNAFALWTNHIAIGPSHSFENMPILIAGSAGGYLKQGQYIDAGNVPNNQLYNTLLTAVVSGADGPPIEDFGSADLPGGQISSIVA
jgi:hypothetical protein